MSTVHLKQSGGAFLVDVSTGIVIGSGDDKVTGKSLGEQPKNSLYAQTAQWLRDGGSGLRFGEVNGKTMYYYIQWVPGVNWAAVGFVPGPEIMADVQVMIRVLLAVGIAGLLILSILIYLMIRRIVIAPVHKLDLAAQRIADGDLTTKVDYRSSDEFGALADNFGKTANRLHSYVDYIDEISKVLNQIARGNLNFRLEHDYVGEFAKIKAALENISDSLNDTISKIDASSQQVSAGAGHLSTGSQSLSQGAAVEAARAGAAGKSFAVVADEVRNLATKSQEAAKSTAALIKASVEAVQKGSAIADETAESLLATVGDIKSITGAVNGISEASERQAESIAQVSEGINQIAEVVQNNSATSEETAASSEELSAQAQLLNELVERFELKK